MAKGLSPRQVQRLVAVGNQRCLSTARLSGSQAAESVLRRHTTKLLELSLNVLWQLLVVNPMAEMVTYSITRAPTVLARLATVKFHILTRVAVLLARVVSLLVVLARTVTEERVQMVTQTLVFQEGAGYCHFGVIDCSRQWDIAHTCGRNTGQVTAISNATPGGCSGNFTSQSLSNSGAGYCSVKLADRAGLAYDNKVVSLPHYKSTLCNLIIRDDTVVYYKRR